MVFIFSNYGQELSICLTPESDPPPNEQFSFPYSSPDASFLSPMPPQYRGMNMHPRGAQIQVLAGILPQEWPQAFPQQGHYTYLHQSSLKQVCLARLAQVVPKGYTTIGGGGCGQQS